ncbi:methyl-accepting chemotaxis protein [Desulfocurvus sp. DL9XJH121]
MSIRFKVLLPLLLAVVVLGGGMYYLMNRNLTALERGFERSRAMAKRAEVLASIESTSQRAREMASLFSRMPAVVEALTLANTGKVDDEADPAGQEARVMLRERLAPVLKGYEEIADGKKFRLHVHLPNARSLLRAWRGKQAKRDGKWMDVSDDLSSFRQTVLDVNKSGRPVQGIELGRGGFVIRGLAPVKGPGGAALGSVEVLLDFAPILDAASTHAGDSLLLYMNADKLPVTTNLQDKGKYPLVGDDFVRVHGGGEDQADKGVDIALLDQGRKDLSLRYRGGYALAAFPVSDYKGAQIGVMVFHQDTSDVASRVDTLGFSMAGMLAAILVALSFITWFLIRQNVCNPVQKVVDKIRDIAEDRADLQDRLDQSRRDEMGELALWFNTLMDKLGVIMRDSAMYKYMMDAVPDPIFAVDENMNFLAGNEATKGVAGKAMTDLLGSRCSKVFQTPVCDTEDCPIQQCRGTHDMVLGEIIEADIHGRKVFIQPIAKELHGPDGKVFGYMEVARNVTDLVTKERDLQAQFDHIAKVNGEIRQASASIGETAQEILGRLEEVVQGADRQRARAGETATAMEEMNATVLEVASNASMAAEQADDMRTRAQNGSEVVGNAVSAIGQVRDRTQALKENMDALGARAQGIGQVLTVITDIADQTNLLALNAAIEAARAGDAGRGFAVVADEVRKLAEKTMQATKEVEAAIHAIQDGTKTNAQSVDASAEAVDRATGLVNESGEALDAIRGLVETSADQVRAIATAVEEQSATSEQINRSVEEVNLVAEETADGMNQAREHIERLLELAATMERLAREED